jgi:hypothetical protein
VSARGVEILDSSLASDNQPFDSAHPAPKTKGATMNLPDALLNAKKYIHEPKYHEKERAWGYERRVNGQWVTYFTITEEACWEAFYKQFRTIKESLMNNQGRTK